MHRVHRALAETSGKGTRANNGRHAEDCSSLELSQTQAKQIEGDVGEFVNAIKEDNKPEGNRSDQKSLKCWTKRTFCTCYSLACSST